MIYLYYLGIYHNGYHPVSSCIGTYYVPTVYMCVCVFYVKWFETMNRRIEIRLLHIYYLQYTIIPKIMFHFFYIHFYIGTIRIYVSTYGNNLLLNTTACLFETKKYLSKAHKIQWYLLSCEGGGVWLFLHTYIVYLFTCNPIRWLFSKIRDYYLFL